MKKILFLMAAFVFVVQFVNAQTEKGAQTLGLNLGFNNTDFKSASDAPGASFNNTSTYSSFNIGPQYSYFIADKLDLGGMLSYRSFTGNNNNSGSATSQANHAFGATAYLRKYLSLSNKLSFRTGPYLSYNQGPATYAYNNSVDNTPATIKSTNRNLESGLGLDLVYYPSKHLGLSANIVNLSFSHEWDSYQSSSVTTNNVNLKLATNAVQFYVFYVFGNK